MEPLNSDLIKSLVKQQKRVNTSCPLYPVEYDFSVCLTDNSIMIEWPKESVALCKAYFDLFENCEHQRSMWRGFEGKHWRSQLIRERRMTGTVMGSMEGDKNEEIFEPIGGAIPFDAKSGRWYYHPSYIEMIQTAVPEASYKLYVPERDQNMPAGIRLLCAFTEHDLVAIVIDQPVREYK